jgi:hypothetical protein
MFLKAPMIDDYEAGLKIEEAGNYRVIRLVFQSAC